MKLKRNQNAPSKNAYTTLQVIRLHDKNILIKLIASIAPSYRWYLYTFCTFRELLYKSINPLPIFEGLHFNKAVHEKRAKIMLEMGKSYPTEAKASVPIFEHKKALERRFQLWEVSCSTGNVNADDK